jgi:WD40 repeat protein/serine/threonine protein kinase/Flp pilus assembly protein TadD
MSDSSADRNPVEELAEEFLERFRRGERPALSEYTSRFPALAGQIRDLFPALVMLEDVRPHSQGVSASSEQLPVASGKKLERLGDYRILREVGRGGMGIVYEAEQESLGRHVALKVLPAQSLLDDRHLQRFQREARAAARLHHTNIVPVFGVGEQDGLHYYVMQFIQGQGLDQVLAVLKRLRGGPLKTDVKTLPSVGMASAAAVAHSLLTGVFALPNVDRITASSPDSHEGDTASVVSATSSDVRLPGQSTQTLSEGGQPYWHSVARIGIQVAQALVYAHTQGTLHRDIKPSNLLLDTQGIVWVTDFGLAKAMNSEDLTHTGDVVGTLRYMAPERFKGRADARSDIYALGLTLYELLTLRPAFDASERNRLFLQVVSLDPARPRKLNAAVPRDLETIVLKAAARDPGDRYQDAEELAEDLRRFTDDKPIRARPVSELEKMWRWCRRNPSMAMLTIALLLALTLGSAGVTWKWREAELRRREAEAQKLNAMAAESETAAKRDEAISARNDTRRTLASVTLDKGIALAVQGEVEEGLFWMLEALKIVPESDIELTRLIRTNLAGWRSLTPNLRQIIERPSAVYGCSFVGGGYRLLAVGSHEVTVWETSTGRLLAVPMNKGGLRAHSPDGKMLLVVDENPEKQGVLHRCDGMTGARIEPPLIHSQAIRHALFSADGKRIITICGEGKVRAWVASSGKLLRTAFETKDVPITRVAISPDGQKMAIVTGDTNNRYVPGAASLWDLATGKRVGQPMRHRANIESVVFSPDSKRILTAGWDGAAQLWDAATGLPATSPLKHPDALEMARFTPDGRTIVTGGSDGSVRWWDSRGYELIGALPLSKMPIHDLEFSPDGKTLAVSSGWNQVGAIHVIDVTRGLSRLVARDRTAILHSFAMPEAANPAWRSQVISYSPGVTRVLTGGGHGCALLIDTATGDPVFLGPGRHSGPFRHAWDAVGATAFSPDGKLFATACLLQSGPSEVRLHDATNGHEIGEPLLHGNYVSAIAFSPDSKVLVTGDYHCLLHMWDARTGQRIGDPIPQPDIVLALAFRADGKVLAVSHSRDYGGKYGTVLWDVAGRRQIGKAIPEAGQAVLFNPNGRSLLTGQWLQLRLWDSLTGEPIGTATSLSAHLSSCAYHREGKWIVVGCVDGTLLVCDGRTGERMGAAMTHPARVNAVAFSPDPLGKLLLAGYADGSARLWDRVSQKLLGPPVLQSKPIKSVAFTPDGRSFLTLADDGATRRWPVPTPAKESVEQLTLQLVVRTGLQMREGQAVVRLLPEQWRELRQQLLHVASPGRESKEISAWDFHNARARDAEQDGDSIGARWHLNRLVTLQAKNAEKWLTYARRARQYTNIGEYDKAAADYSRARELGSVEKLVNWYRYCILDCLKSEQWQAAQWYIERVLVSAPDDWHLYADRALVNDRLGRSKEWLADVKRAIGRGSERTYQLQSIEAFARRGLWKEARSTMLEAAERGPLPITAVRPLILMRLKWAERVEYRRLCRVLLEHAGEQPPPQIANLIAWIGVMAPRAVDDYSQLIALAEDAVKKASPAEKRGILNTLGAVLYRAGRHRESIARLRESMAAAKGERKFHDWVFLAMAYQRVGEAAEARKYLDMVQQQTLVKDGDPWEKLEMELLQKEAEELIKGNDTDCRTPRGPTSAN